MRSHAVCRTPGLLLLAVCLVGGCQGRNEFVPPPPPQVTVARPLERPVQEYFETTGQTRAVQVAELRARVGGYLQEIYFQDGDFVEAGQLLFVIDPAPYEAAFQSTQAAHAKAKAQLELADRQLERLRNLATRQATTQSELEIQQAEVDSAAADVAATAADMRNAELELSYTKIHAPFAGRIGQHLVDVGNLVQTGTTLLASLESVDPIHAYFTVSESELLRFLELQREGKLTISEADPLTVELALGESGDFAFQGKLDFRQFGVDPQTGTTQRRAIYANPEGRLIPGLFIRIRAAVGPPQTRLLVDERAIGADQRGDYLLIVNDKNLVEQRSVRLGPLADGLRAIESGLNANERVVISGLQRARPGGEVVPEEIHMDARRDSPAPQPVASGSTAVPAAAHATDESLPHS